MAEALPEVDTTANMAEDEQPSTASPEKSKAKTKIVYINNVPKMTLPLLKQWLQATYGPISRVVVRKHKKTTARRQTNNDANKSQYALVTFPSVDAADSAIAAGARWPNGKRICVKRHAEKTTPSDDVGHTFLLDQLAPEYLFNIYQYLSPLDIANASLTSEYLSNFAEANIYKKYANCKLFCDDDEDANRHPTYTLHEFKLILQYFGSHFKRMTLDAQHLHGATVNHLALVLESCPNLDELSVLNFNFGKNSIKVLRKVTCNVRLLALECYGVDKRWVELLKEWPKVTALTIHRFYDELLPGQLVSGMNTLTELTLVNGLMTSVNLFMALQKHKDTFRKLTLVEMNEYTEDRYDSISQLMPNIEHLQISVNCATEMRALAGMDLKFLQLVGYASDVHQLDFDWVLSGLPMLEELDLVDVAGTKIRVATGVPTIRYLGVQHSSLVGDSVLSETIAKLPNLERLRLRKCGFSPDELFRVIASTESLKEVELDLVPRGPTLQLLKSLVDKSKRKSSSGAIRPTFALKIVFNFFDNELNELCAQLPFVSKTLTPKHKKLGHRFDEWDAMLEAKDDLDHDYDDIEDDDDFFYNYSDDDDYDYDTDGDEYELAVFNHMNDNGLGLGNAILEDIFQHMF